MSTVAPDQSDADPARRSYVVVARRYRPQTFGELIGQQMVARAMRNAIETDRVGHAYLFTGARGVGKTSAARILAKALNCAEGPKPDPCNQCDICRGISSGEDVDVLEIDGASNRGIDEIRQLRSNVSVRPSRCRFKIYIIDEVHMLTREAFNALLKTLEEPPRHVKFIFCTTDPEKIPITVLSRCQRYDFAPVETAAIAKRLGQIVAAEGAQAEPQALQILARRAAGSMRDSQSLLEQLLAFAGQQITVEDVHHMLGTARTGRLRILVKHLIEHDAAAALGQLDAAVEEGVDVGQLTEQLLGYMRDMMAASVGCGVELMLHSSEEDYPTLLDAAQHWGLETLLAAVQILDQAVARMRQSVHVRTLAEMAIVRSARLDDLAALPDLIAQLKANDGAPRMIRSGAASTGSARTGQPEATPVESGKKKTSQAAERAVIHPPHRAESEAAGGGGRPTAVGPQPDSPRSARPDHPPSSSGRPSPVLSAAKPKPATARSVPPDTDIWQAVTPSAAEQLWRQTLDHLGDMTADFGRQFASVATFAPNRLVVAFGPNYNASKSYCERAEPRARLEEAFAQVSGKAVHIEFRLLSEDPAHARPERRVVPIRERMREVHSHPMVQKAVELFDAEVVNVDLPASGNG